MKYLLIGHSVVDHILFDEKEIIKPGGIYYSILGLNSFLSEKDELFLISEIDNTNEYLFKDLYENNINKKYIRMVENIPSVRIKFSEGKIKCDSFDNIDQNLRIDKQINFNEFDGILINMATGFDVTLEDMLYIRKKYNGVIYFDVHMLSHNYDKKKGRRIRLIPDVKEWISCADIIQVNGHEVFSLVEKKNEADIANQVLDEDLKGLIITKGEYGASIFMQENNELKSFSVRGKKNNSKNKVGCGDIFGATFFYFYLQDKNYLKALNAANISAFCSMSYDNINDFKKLKDDTFTKLNKE